MKNPLKFWLGTLTVFLLALTPSVVPMGGSVAPASAATVSESGGSVCSQTVSNASSITVTKRQISGQDYCVITFERVGTTTWTVPTGVTNVDFLLIGGGGAGGGSNEGGGGGAGGFVERTNYPMSGTPSIVVGSGGLSSPSRSVGAGGTSSQFGGQTAAGGGGGGAGSGTSSGSAGDNGGSGGGGGGWGDNSGSSNPGNGNVGSSSPSFGNQGGSGAGNNGGGGGGAGGQGGNGVLDNRGGNGGAGKASSMSGSSVTYAGGGGGGSSVGNSVATTSGGSGGGGNEGSNGRDGFGGGGGGAGNSSSAGSGGSGIVIVRYALTPNAPSSTAVISGDGSMTFTYAAPSYWGGGTLSLEYTTDGGSNWRSLGETDGNTTVSLESDGTALQNNTVYTVKLRSKNTVGGSSYTSTEVTVGSVIPSPVGEILRLDGTNPSSYGGSGSTWTDLSGESNHGTISNATWVPREKAFSVAGNTGSGNAVTLPSMAYDFSNGLAIHAVVDFGDSADSYEKIIDLGNGSGNNNIVFGRFGTTSDFSFDGFDGTGGARTDTGYCKTNEAGGDDGILAGVHVYSVVISAAGACSLYVDGVEQTNVVVSRDGSTWVTSQSGYDFRPDSDVVRAQNYVADSSWGGVNRLEGSLQSITVYNTAQTTPVCKPIETTFTGNGTIGTSGVTYKALAFTTVGDCEWAIPTGVGTVDALLVAGGGGGGAHVGSGGGAGGFVEYGALSAGSSPITVTVGNGGAGGFCDGLYNDGDSAAPCRATNHRAASGGDSSILSRTADGGGSGGSWDYFAPRTGGSGGGASASGVGPAASTGAGNAGGGYTNTYWTGGGGGAGSVGGSYSNVGGQRSGNGGAGTVSELFPHATIGALAAGAEDPNNSGFYYFAGGGAGGYHNSGQLPSVGGLGGGGDGNTSGSTDGSVALAVSGGGGGGGGGSHLSASSGGDGGSGLVMVRYSLSPAAPAISSVSSGDGSLSVSFSAPTHTGGSAITDYEYSFNGSTWTSFGSAIAGTKTISGLTNGTAYTPRIRAVNGNGNGVPVVHGSSVTPRGSQTLTWSPTNTSVEVTDGSVTLAPVASALGGVSIQYSVQSQGGTSCAIADNSTPTVTFSAIGDCVVRATAVQGGAYLSATTDVTLSVVKAAQTVTFASVSAKTYGDASFSVSPSASSALTVTLTSSTTSVCTVSTFTVTLVAAGTCTLVAAQGGNSSYEAASSVSRTFTVAPKAITMSVSIADKNYDGLSSATVSGTPTLIGLVSGDANFVAVDTAEITAAFADPDAGAGKSVSVTLGDDVLITGSSGDKSASYTVALASTPTATISKISQATLSLASASSMVFGQSIPLVATGGSGSGALSYSKVSGPCTVSGSTVTSTGAGSCVVTATRATDTNYNSVTSSNFTITVAKANQSINFTSTVPVSAVSGTTYTPAATATSGLTPSFSITTGSGTVCSLSSGVVTFLTSGTCVITAAQSGDSDYNAASSVTQTIVAGKINQTISFPAISGKDFDDPAFSAGASVSSGRTVTYATSTGSVCAVNASSGVVSIKTVGDCTVTASSAGDASYAAASDVSRTFTISPVVAGKPSITSVSFGDSSVTVAFGAPSFVGGDSIDGYQVVATSSGGSVTKPDCSTTSPCTMTGLTNGSAYTLTVAAINAAGVGPASDASPSITPARIADAVSGLATTPGDEQLAVSWTALTNDQVTAAGGTFTRYDVYLRVNGGAWGSAVNVSGQSSNSYTFTGLTNGTAYDVKVVAITNANSTELSSNTSTALGVPATTPAAVSGLTATALSNTTALASWSAPLDDGGSAITAYSVNLSCTFVNATDTFCELSGLTAGSTVTVTVGGTNLMGTGSTVSVSITMPGGSSGSSGGGSSGGGETVTAAPAPATNLPVVSPRRVIVPLQPTPRPRPFAAPVRIVPERGFDPDAGAKARIGGQPATVTKKPLDEGGLSVEAGAFQLGITLATPPTGGVSGERENTDISVPTGQSTKVSGGGLLPGSSLQVWLPGMTGESPKELARIPVRTDGTFDSELSFTARQSETPIPIGRQVMQVTGFDEDGNQTVVDMVVNIGQGAPAPEPNRTVNELPDLSPGQSLATSAGVPETVTIEARPDDREVAVISGAWSFSVALPDDAGEIDQVDAGATITMVQTKTATVSGEGFQPDTRVDIWLFSDPTLLGSVIVSADGSFTGEVYMDVRYATVGEHTLQLQGVAHDGFIKAANLGVVVQEPVDFTSDSAGGLVLWVIVVALAVALVVVVLVLLLGRRRQLRS